MIPKNCIIMHQEIHKETKQDDLDVLVQAEEIKKILENKGVNVIFLEADKDFRFIDSLKKCSDFFVFNLVETFNGSGANAHIVPLILEQMKIPFTGNNSQAVFLTSDKISAKEIMSCYKIPTPNWYYKVFEKIPHGIYIFKPVAEDASLGIDDENLIMIDSFDKIRKSFSLFEKKHITPFFCEKFIEGREFNISMLEINGKPVVLPPAEMLFKKSDMKFQIVDYESKWDEDSEKYKNSVRSFARELKDSVLIEKLTKISLECWRIFNLKGYVRVDFRVDSDNNPYVLEINANPCLSPDSGFYAAALMENFDFEKIVMAIVDGALNENKEKNFSE